MYWDHKKSLEVINGVFSWAAHLLKSVLSTRLLVLWCKERCIDMMDGMATIYINQTVVEHDDRFQCVLLGV
jgi:hypothetical protein